MPDGRAQQVALQGSRQRIELSLAMVNAILFLNSILPHFFQFMVQKVDFIGGNTGSAQRGLDKARIIFFQFGRSLCLIRLRSGDERRLLLSTLATRLCEDNMPLFPR